MNTAQTNELKQLLVSLKIEKQDLQAQKVALNAEHDEKISAINARIDVINAKILTIKEGVE